MGKSDDLQGYYFVSLSSHFLITFETQKILNAISFSSFPRWNKLCSYADQKPNWNYATFIDFRNFLGSIMYINFRAHIYLWSPTRLSHVWIFSLLLLVGPRIKRLFVRVYWPGEQVHKTCNVIALVGLYCRLLSNAKLAMNESMARRKSWLRKNRFHLDTIIGHNNMGNIWKLRSRNDLSNDREPEVDGSTKYKLIRVRKPVELTTELLEAAMMKDSSQKWKSKR